MTVNAQWLEQKVCALVAGKERGAGHIRALAVELVRKCGGTVFAPDYLEVLGHQDTDPGVAVVLACYAAALAVAAPDFARDELGAQARAFFLHLPTLIDRHVVASPRSARPDAAVNTLADLAFPDLPALAHGLVQTWHQGFPYSPPA